MTKKLLTYQTSLNDDYEN